jgi:hypothetical protein
MKKIFLLSLLSLAGTAAGQAPQNQVNPAVKQITDAISQGRIEATLHKLEGFGTRYVMSSQDDSSKGIGAARRWIHDQFQSFSPRLEVTDQSFTVKKGASRGQVFHDVELANIVAVLPGTTEKDQYLLVTAHYDSVDLVRKPKLDEQERLADLLKRGMDESEARHYMQLFPTREALPEVDPEPTAQAAAPGVTDDGSGVAAVLELARVMSQHEFEKTVVFVAFAGEEIGLEGSKAFAADAKEKGLQIEGVLNNDIIGSEVAGNGRSESSVVRVFADGPEDSPGRALLRYAKQIAERYVPSMKVEMVFHRDRFLRGGDHTAFSAQGFAAVRFTSASENYSHQHSATDNFENTSVPYATRVARMNAAVLASLAWAPPPPVVNWTFASGDRKGERLPLLSRGESGYDAVLRWEPSKISDVAGYAVVIRSTTAPDWEREIWVNNVTSYTLADFSVDDVVIGVKAVDRNGNQSLVSTYLEPISARLTGKQ